MSARVGWRDQLKHTDAWLVVTLGTHKQTHMHTQAAHSHTPYGPPNRPSLPLGPLLILVRLEPEGVRALSAWRSGLRVVLITLMTLLTLIALITRGPTPARVCVGIAQFLMIV